jgi:sugar lactone lactonase YvrE
VTRLDEGDVFIRAAGTLCEGPCWHARTGRLVWVDILAGRVASADPATGETEHWELGTPVGAVAPRASGGWVAAVERGFLRLDTQWASDGPVAAAPSQPDGTRFNDGRCDGQGRFWAGTLAYDGTPGVASLYRFDPDGTVTRVLAGVTNSNGLAWSPDGSAMYYVDTGRGTVDRMSFDPVTGDVSLRRTLVRIPPADGVPDGLTVDSEGFFWLALWGGGSVRRYAPDGTLERTVHLPVEQVTSMTFGGTDLDELFITTASDGLDAAQLRDQPLAGSLFRHRPGVAGLPPAQFAG